jgi:hypothetical protein
MRGLGVLNTAAALIWKPGNADRSLLQALRLNRKPASKALPNRTAVAGSGT